MKAFPCTAVKCTVLILSEALLIHSSPADSRDIFHWKKPICSLYLQVDAFYRYQMMLQECKGGTITFTSQEFYLLLVLKRTQRAQGISQINLHVAFAKLFFTALVKVGTCVVFEHFSEKEKYLVES